MINFLRISNNIKLGDYLHSDGNIDDKVSFDIIGVCVIPSDFLPDRYARFISLCESRGPWARTPLYLKKSNFGLDSYPEDSKKGQYLSPYRLDGSFNLDFLKDMEGGNIFQDYKGYEIAELYKKKSKENIIDTAFATCNKIVHSYKRNEWYLPTIGELTCIPPRYEKIGIKIQEAISTGSIGDLFGLGYCWSSSERDKSQAWSLSLSPSRSYCIGCAPKVYDNNRIRAFLAL